MQTFEQPEFETGEQFWTLFNQAYNLWKQMDFDGSAEKHLIANGFDTIFPEEVFLLAVDWMHINRKREVGFEG